MSVTLVRAVTIGYVQTLTVLTTAPDQVGQPTERDAAQVSQHIQDVAITTGQQEMLDHLTDWCMHHEYAECPGGADASHQRRKSRHRK